MSAVSITYFEKPSREKNIDDCQQTGVKFKRTFLKGPVKLIQRVKMAHSFLYFVSNQFHFNHFKLAFVVLHVAVKELFETHF